MKKEYKLFLIVIIVSSVLKNNCFGRYFEKIDEQAYYANIAEPIFIVTPFQETNEFKLDKNNTNKEYLFVIKNYENMDDNIRISEVDFKFNIEILLSNNSYPLQLKLIDCTNNEEIQLDNLNKTKDFIIKKNELFEKQYKLIIYWDKIFNLAENINVEVIINSSQNN